MKNAKPNLKFLPIKNFSLKLRKKILFSVCTIVIMIADDFFHRHIWQGPKESKCTWDYFSTHKVHADILNFITHQFILALLCGREFVTFLKPHSNLWNTDSKEEENYVYIRTSCFWKFRVVKNAFLNMILFLIFAFDHDFQVIHQCLLNIEERRYYWHLNIFQILVVEAIEG